MLLHFVIPFCYFLILDSLISTTIGKKLVGLRVIDERGFKISFNQSLSRNIGKIRPELTLLDYIIGNFLVKPSNDLRLLEIWAGTSHQLYDPMNGRPQGARNAIRVYRIILSIIGGIILALNIFLYLDLILLILGLLY